MVQLFMDGGGFMYPILFIFIIGLGFVGLTLTITMANRGFKIIGVEKNKLIILKNNFF